MANKIFQSLWNVQVQKPKLLKYFSKSVKNNLSADVQSEKNPQVANASTFRELRNRFCETKTKISSLQHFGNGLMER